MSSGWPWVPEGDPLAELPKVVLHDHLDGSIRPETLVEVLVDQGGAAILPSRDPAAVEQWLHGDGALGRPLDHHELFALLCEAMQTPDTIRRVASEYVAALAADGVVYAEVRWAPEKHVRRGLTLDDAVEAVGEGLADGMATAAAAGDRVDVRQLLCCIRGAPLETASEIAELTVRHRGHTPGSVIGFDLAGWELAAPTADFAEAFRIVRDAGVPATLHAGEADGVDSIRDAIERCYPQRIGHGTRLAEDFVVDGRRLLVGDVVAAWDGGGVALGPVAARVHADRIPLEQCPSSNSGWVVPDLAAHPVDMLHRLGFAVTVNPDNRMLSATSVTREFRRLADTFGWTGDDFAAVTRTAAAAAFADVAV